HLPRHDQARHHLRRRGLTDHRRRIPMFPLQAITQKKGLDQAVRLYEQGMACGSEDATHELALCYEEGRGVRKSNKRAFALMKTASRKGDIAATHVLGWYYHNGIGTRPNASRAMRAYRRAAARGGASSGFNIGLLLWSRNSHKSRSAAMEWFEWAALCGHPRSFEFLETGDEAVLDVPSKEGDGDDLLDAEITSRHFRHGI
ncbi:MAG: tetratricopeptide repeat protein, partial [Proteobacteria bacterium]|nr:tetratricopeptide repeat protein [Pseudomonadota bacterium]